MYMIPVDFDFAQDFESVCICGTKSKRDSKRTARWEDPEASVRAGQIDGKSTQKPNTASKRLTTMSKHNLLQVWRDFKPVLARIWAELYDAYLDSRFLKQTCDDVVIFRDLYKVDYSPPGKW